MNTEELSAEEILESTAGHPIDAMEQYARQQNYALREQLKQRDETIKELNEENERLRDLIDLKYAGLSDPINFTTRQSQKKQIQQLREALKELIPIAQWGYDLLVPFDKERMGKTWPSNIDNANKLLTK